MEDYKLWPFKSETLKPINTRYCTFDYVVQISGCAKNHNDRLHRGAPTHKRNITFTLCLFCILAPSPNGDSHKGQQQLKTRVSVLEVLSWGSVDDLSPEGSKNKKNAKI